MKHVLSRDAKSLLARYAWSNTVVALDFDGTLAPIVDQPDRARMAPSTRARLVRVAERFPCVVISGRAWSDVKARVQGVPLLAIVGNHGLEPSRRMSEYATRVDGWLPHLEAALGREQGVDIEDKRYSLAVHYRRSRRKRAAREAIVRAVAGLGPSVRTIGGKQVVNVVPVGAPHKGMALERLRADAGADTAIYVGDDVTDEDVFGLDQPGRLLSIRVGRTLRTAAPYYLQNQAEIDRLLDCLIALRAEKTSHRLEER
jgi:trehalose 6-phosphate phosphatase